MVLYQVSVRSPAHLVGLSDKIKSRFSSQKRLKPLTVRIHSHMSVFISVLRQSSVSLGVYPFQPGWHLATYLPADTFLASIPLLNYFLAWQPVPWAASTIYHRGWRWPFSIIDLPSPSVCAYPTPMHHPKNALSKEMDEAQRHARSTCEALNFSEDAGPADWWCPQLPLIFRQLYALHVNLNHP